MQRLWNEYKGCRIDHIKLYQAPENTPEQVNYSYTNVLSIRLLQHFQKITKHI